MSGQVVVELSRAEAVEVVGWLRTLQRSAGMPVGRRVLVANSVAVLDRAISAANAAAAVAAVDPAERMRCVRAGTEHSRCRNAEGTTWDYNDRCGQ